MGIDPVLAISFAVYTSLIISIGLYSTRKSRKTSDEFVLANRELGPWVAALSSAASAESGWVMLGLVGTAFSNGISSIWIIPGIGAGYLFNWFVIAERLRLSTQSSGAATLPQYIASRFGKDSPILRWLPALIIIGAMLGYVAAQMNGAGKAFEAVFHLPYWLGVLIGALIILAYSVTGGFRAICWTDVVQASFMAVALIGMPVLLYLELGGITNVIQTLEPSHPELLTFSGGRGGMALLGFVVGMLGIGFGYPGQPHILSRFMATRDKESVRKGGWIAFGWFLIVYFGAIIFGVLARAYFNDLADPEQALPIAVGTLLPPIIGGFVIAAIVAAICSTADSQLLVISTTISRDLLGRSEQSSPDSFAKLQRTDRIVLLLLALVSVGFALSENRLIFTFVLYAWGVLGAAFGPVIIMGLLWKGANKAGAIAGMITGAVVAILWKEIDFLSSVVYELVPAFILATMAIVIVSLINRKNEAVT